MKVTGAPRSHSGAEVQVSLIEREGELERHCWEGLLQRKAKKWWQLVGEVSSRKVLFSCLFFNDGRQWYILVTMGIIQ